MYFLNRNCFVCLNVIERVALLIYYPVMFCILLTRRRSFLPILDLMLWCVVGCAFLEFVLTENNVSDDVCPSKYGNVGNVAVDDFGDIVFVDFGEVFVDDIGDIVFVGDVNLTIIFLIEFHISRGRFFVTIPSKHVSNSCSL